MPGKVMVDKGVELMSLKGVRAKSAGGERTAIKIRRRGWVQNTRWDRRVAALFLAFSSLLFAQACHADDGILEVIENKIDAIIQQVGWDAALSPSTTFAAVYLGITGEDKAGTGPTIAPNGIPDNHISISGLKGTPVNIEISNGAGAVWNTPYLSLTGSYMVAAQYGASGAADFWFEPYGTSTKFHVKVTYADGTVDEADAFSATPISPSLAPSSPPVDQTFTGAPPSREYFLSASSGDDRNPGTLKEPFKTLQKAVPLLKPGQTLIVRGGDYDTINGLLSRDKKNFLLPSGASWDKPVTIKAYPGEVVTFRRYVATSTCCVAAGTTDADFQGPKAPHMPTPDECAVWAKTTNTPVDSYPFYCWTGSGSAGDGLWYQSAIGYVDGYVLDLVTPWATAMPVQYVVFDGINMDALGMTVGVIAVTNRNPNGTGTIMARHIRWQNLEIRNSIASCVATPGLTNQSGLDWQFVNIKIHHCGVPFDKHMIGDKLARKYPLARFYHPWYQHGPMGLFDRVESYENAGTGAAPGNGDIFQNSYIHDNAIQGIRVEGGAIVRGNVIVNNGGFGIEITNVSKATISHNTIVAGPLTSVDSGIYFQTSAWSNLVENNIVSGFAHGITNSSSNATAPNFLNTARNNLVRSSRAPIQNINTTTLVQSGNLTGDPLFADAARGDFSLKPGSPAIGKATDGRNIGAK